MFSLKHEINIQAGVDTIFKALVTKKGLSSWWTADVEAKPEMGSKAVFGFFDRETVFTMNIDNITSENIKWTCIDGPEEWINTELTFDLEIIDGGATKVKFNHSKWRKEDGAFPLCNTTWGHLMMRLKEYCEGLNPGPYFK